MAQRCKNIKKTYKYKKIKTYKRQFYKKTNSDIGFKKRSFSRKRKSTTDPKKDGLGTRKREKNTCIIMRFEKIGQSHIMQENITGSSVCTPLQVSLALQRNSLFTNYFVQICV